MAPVASVMSVTVSTMTFCRPKSERLLEGAAALCTAKPDAVMWDTALHSARWIPELEAALGKPVLTANQVTVWRCLRLAGALRPSGAVIGSGIGQERRPGQQAAGGSGHCRQPGRLPAASCPLLCGKAGETGVKVTHNDHSTAQELCLGWKLRHELLAGAAKYFDRPHHDEGCHARELGSRDLHVELQ